MWIIQEISKSVGATVLCGSRSITWDVLSRTLKSLRSHRQLINSPSIQHVVSLEAFRSRESLRTRGSLLEVIVDSRRSKSTDPTDKIYAILGLAADGPDVVPLPSYGLRSNEVFLNTTKSLLETYPNSVSWMVVAHRTDRPSKDWPSWGSVQEKLPDWALSRIRAPSNKTTRLIGAAAVIQHPTIEISVVILDTIDGVFSAFSDTSGTRYQQTENQNEANPNSVQQSRYIFSEIYKALSGVLWNSKDSPRGRDYKITAYAIYLYSKTTSNENPQTRRDHSRITGSEWINTNSSIILQGKSLSDRLLEVEKAGNPSIFGNSTFGISRKGKQKELDEKTRYVHDCVTEA